MIVDNKFEQNRSRQARTGAGQCHAAGGKEIGAFTPRHPRPRAQDPPHAAIGTHRLAWPEGQRGVWNSERRHYNRPPAQPGGLQQLPPELMITNLRGNGFGRWTGAALRAWPASKT